MAFTWSMAARASTCPDTARACIRARSCTRWIIPGLVILVAVLGAEWGATGAAVAVLVSTLVFAAAWLVVVARLRDEVHAGEVSLQP